MKLLSFDEFINESRQGKPMFQDTPNEFAYLDFKKWAYKKRGTIKKELQKALGNREDSTKMFIALRNLWMQWASKHEPSWSYTHSTDTAKKDFGRALAMLMKNDNLIISKRGNKLTLLEANVTMTAADDTKQYDSDKHDRDHIQGDLHKQFIEDTKKAKEDFATKKQTIKDNKGLKVGDYALHRDKQSMGPGEIKKIHPSSHADLHFNVNLKSSLIDGPEDYKTFTFHINDLIPVVGTSDT
jgi:hypothetical protein